MTVTRESATTRPPHAAEMASEMPRAPARRSGARADAGRSATGPWGSSPPRARPRRRWRPGSGSARRRSPPTSTTPTRERYRVSVAEYVRFHEEGFLVVKGLLNAAEVAELKAHSEDLMYGRVQVPGLEPPTPGPSAEEVGQPLPAHPHAAPPPGDRGALPPPPPPAGRAGGPHRPGRDGDADDVLRQGPRGRRPGVPPGQLLHPHLPRPASAGPGSRSTGRTRRTAASGSPPARSTSRSTPPRSGWGRTTATCATWTVVQHVSHTDTEVNTLSRIAARYPGQERPAIAEPGDVVFFGGHILHRSHTNRAPTASAGPWSATTATPAPSPCGAAPGRRSSPTTCTSWPAAGRTSPSGAPLRHPLRRQPPARRPPRTGASRCPRR